MDELKSAGPGRPRGLPDVATIEQLRTASAELDGRREDLEQYGRDDDGDQIAALRAAADFLDREVTRRHRRSAFRKVRVANLTDEDKGQRAATKAPTRAMVRMLAALPCASTEIPSVYGTHATWGALVRRGWAYYSKGRLAPSNEGRRIRREFEERFRPTQARGYRATGA